MYVRCFKHLRLSPNPFAWVCKTSLQHPAKLNRRFDPTYAAQTKHLLCAKLTTNEASNEASKSQLSCHLQGEDVPARRPLTVSQPFGFALSAVKSMWQDLAWNLFCRCVQLSNPRWKTVWKKKKTQMILETLEHLQACTFLSAWEPGEIDCFLSHPVVLAAGRCSSLSG